MNDPRNKPDVQYVANDQCNLDVGFLPVGVTHRPTAGIYKAPNKVQSATDLPVRLYLGSLIENTFHKSDEGWDVRYEDFDSDTYVNLEYRQARDQLVARFTWKGIYGISVGCRANNWKALTLQWSMWFPEDWDEGAKQDIEAGFNAQYVAKPDKSPSMTGFPDGARRTLIFPLPSYRLNELTGLLDALDSDKTIAAVVSVAAVMTQNRVDYIQGRCEDVPDTPEELARQSRKLTGLPCHGLPEVSTVEDSQKVLTINRWIYLVHIGCTFRDLMRVMLHCQDQDLIGMADLNCTPSEYPHGMEWTAFVLPGGFECMDIRPQYVDRARTRRIAYGQLLSLKRLFEMNALRDISRVRRQTNLDRWRSDIRDNSAHQV